MSFRSLAQTVLKCPYPRLKSDAADALIRTLGSMPRLTGWRKQSAAKSFWDVAAGPKGIRLPSRIVFQCEMSETTRDGRCDEEGATRCIEWLLLDPMTVWATDLPRESAGCDGRDGAKSQVHPATAQARRQPVGASCPRLVNLVVRPIEAYRWSTRVLRGQRSIVGGQRPIMDGRA